MSTLNLGFVEARYVQEASRLFLGGHECVLVIVEVYMDESGTHDDSQVVTVSATWAKPDTWKQWTIDWCKQKTPIKVFHSVDCHNRCGEFEGWTKKQRDAFVIDLLPIINKHEICGKIAGLDKKELSELLQSRPDVAGWAGDMYFVCFQWAIEGVWRTLEQAGHRNIAFIHETNDYRTIAAEVFGYSRKRFSNSSATLTFGCKKEYVPLQAADILAYNGNRQLRDFGAELNKPLRAVDPTGQRFAFIKYDRSEMEKMATFLIKAFDQKGF